MNNVEQVKNRVMNRGRSLAASAVGKAYAVKLNDKKTTVRGTLSRCVVSGARNRGASVVCQFSVWVKGPNGFEHGPFVVEQLPR